MNSPPILEPVLVVGLGCSLGVRDFDPWPFQLPTNRVGAESVVWRCGVWVDSHPSARTGGVQIQTANPNHQPSKPDHGSVDWQPNKFEHHSLQAPDIWRKKWQPSPQAQQVSSHGAGVRSGMHQIILVSLGVKGSPLTCPDWKITFPINEVCFASVATEPRSVLLLCCN